MKTHHFFCISWILFPRSIALYNLSYSRNDPTLPLFGTVNWELVSDTLTNIFSPRHGHATCTFKCPFSDKTCIWLTGGRTELYRTFDLYYEDRAADIWWSEDGSIWNKVMNVTGDFIFGLGNHDAKVGGEVAPWYGRYGHSLDAIDTNGDGLDDVMLLMGGFNPTPSNDVWLSINGTAWSFIHLADWSERAYHASAVFQGHLWIMGGSPLTNDVWSGEIFRTKPDADIFQISWTLQVTHRQAPWAPRAGMCCVVQQRLERNSLNRSLEIREKLYIIGGYAAWPRDDPRWDEGRTRNDVWITENGIDWTRIKPPAGNISMPFVGRGWHSCITWHDPYEKFRAVGIHTNISRLYNLSDDDLKKTWPRIYLSGGGYTGTKGNNVVTALEGYLDLWWSHDGGYWSKVNYQEGYKESLYSTNEWTYTIVNNTPYYLGKWGHSIESISIDVDLNNDGFISSHPVSLNVCAELTSSDTWCQIMNVSENEHPALVVIGGDTTDGGPIVNDVYVSRPGIFCELNGISCSGQGVCGPRDIGCVCRNSSFSGDYCEEIQAVSSGRFATPKLGSASTTILVIMITLIIRFL